MSKMANRAAAKAWHQERERQRQEASRQKEIAKDLEMLGKLRRYLIFESRTDGPREQLRDAIDDYVEKLTGDRTKLHTQQHSIG